MPNPSHGHPATEVWRCPEPVVPQDQEIGEAISDLVQSFDLENRTSVDPAEQDAQDFLTYRELPILYLWCLCKPESKATVDRYLAKHPRFFKEPDVAQFSDLPLLWEPGFVRFIRSLPGAETFLPRLILNLRRHAEWPLDATDLKKYATEYKGDPEAIIAVHKMGMLLSGDEGVLERFRKGAVASLSIALWEEFNPRIREFAAKVTALDPELEIRDALQKKDPVLSLASHMVNCIYRFYLLSLFPSHKYSSYAKEMSNRLQEHWRKDIRLEAQKDSGESPDAKSLSIETAMAEIVKYIRSPALVGIWTLAAERIDLRGWGFFSDTFLASWNPDLPQVSGRPRPIPDDFKVAGGRRAEILLVKLMRTEGNRYLNFCIGVLGSIAARYEEFEIEAICDKETDTMVVTIKGLFENRRIQSTWKRTKKRKNGSFRVRLIDLLEDIREADWDREKRVATFDVSYLYCKYRPEEKRHYRDLAVHDRDPNFLRKEGQRPSEGLLMNKRLHAQALRKWYERATECLAGEVGRKPMWRRNLFFLEGDELRTNICPQRVRIVRD